jgi:basic amino acid/polyamine antiporter, APA family
MAAHDRPYRYPEVVTTSDLPSGAPQRRLTLFDCVCIIVGIIIGAGIFETTPKVAGSVAGPGWLILAWLLGGLVSLVGALCYAELATAYPRDGGDYVFLTRAFGRRTGLLFAWASFWIVRPGNIGAMAYIFARYAGRLWPIGTGGFDPTIYAAGAVVPLTLLNVAGVRPGKWTQNTLTAAKVLGLLAVVLAGFLTQAPDATATRSVPGAGDFGFAMILVLFTFGGWNEMAYVAAEVRRPETNILRALVLGTAVVTGVYLLVNLAAVAALGFHGLRGAPAFAADVVGTRVIGLLVCVSCLGAINGMIFTGARIFYAVGTEHRLCRWLGYWHPRLGTPARALMLQAVVTLGLMVGFGLYPDGFDRLVVFTGPMFWLFLLMTGVALFVLRIREPATPRPYRVLLYPWTPALFCLSTAYMLYASVSYAWQQRYVEGFWAAAVMVVGLGWVWYEGRSAER